MLRRVVRYRGSQGLVRINELGRRLGRGHSAQRISAPALDSGDRRSVQFTLAKGKLHGLLSSAELWAFSRRSKCWEARQSGKGGARSFPEGRLRPLERSHCAWLICWYSSCERALRE